MLTLSMVIIACAASAPAGMVKLVPSPVSTLPPEVPTFCMTWTFLPPEQPTSASASRNVVRMDGLPKGLRRTSRFLLDQGNAEPHCEKAAATCVSLQLSRIGLGVERVWPPTTQKQKAGPVVVSWLQRRV